MCESAAFDSLSPAAHNTALEANGSWWASRSSKPTWGVKSVLGVFDSHAPPPSHYLTGVLTGACRHSTTSRMLP